MRRLALRAGPIPRNIPSHNLGAETVVHARCERLGHLPTALTALRSQRSRGQVGTNSSLPQWWPGVGGERQKPPYRQSDGQKRTWRIGALSSPLVTVPWSVVEDEQPKMVGSETDPPRYESYGDGDAKVRVIAGTGADTGRATGRGSRRSRRRREGDPAVRADLTHRRRLGIGEGLAPVAGAVRDPQNRPQAGKRDHDRRRARCDCANLAHQDRDGAPSEGPHLLNDEMGYRAELHRRATLQATRWRWHSLGRRPRRSIIEPYRTSRWVQHAEGARVERESRRQAGIRINNPDGVSILVRACELGRRVA